MRENRFSENSCPGRKTNSQHLLPMAVWPTLRQGRPGSVPPGSGSPCRERPAGTTPPPRTPCFLLLHFLSPLKSFPAGLWGHCVHEFGMRLTAALTKDPLLGVCRRLWGRIRQTVTPGAFSDPLSHKNRWERMAGISAVPRLRLFRRALLLHSFKFTGDCFFHVRMSLGCC